jgi:hypothetical protein
MTMRIHYKVVCDCGHTGEVVMSENDTHYGKSNWQTYSVRDLIASPNSNPENSDWEIIFKSMRITCPKCNSILSDKNLK